MTIINNYLDNLAYYLPENNRQEVREEMESIIYSQIEDKQEELNRELSQQEINTILLKLGHPMKVAANYRDNQVLISQEYFPLYRRVLELVLVIVCLWTVITDIGYVFSDANFIKILFKFLFGFIENGIWAFAYITIIFWALQTARVDMSAFYQWHPSSLKSRKSKLRISRAETLFEICVYLIFLAWWNEIFVLDGISWFEDKTQSVSLSSEWQSVFWSVNLIVGIGLINDIARFVQAGWNKATLYINLSLSIATLIVLTQIARFDSLVVLNEEIQSQPIVAEVLERTQYSVVSLVAVIAMFVAADIWGTIRKLRA